MRITVGPWFWAVYLVLTALLFAICAASLYLSRLMQATCS